MSSSARGPRRIAVALGLAPVEVALAIAALGLAACGDDDADGGSKVTPAAPTALAITTADAGKGFKTTAPKTIEGGLVELSFTNAGKAPHEAQLVRIDGDQTAQDAVEIVTTDKPGFPDWFHAAGGLGSTGPGQTAKTTLNLPAGRYVMVDNVGRAKTSNSRRGALAEFTVTAGEDGALPASTATITMITDEQAKPENSFEISGLKTGPNRVRLVNEGGELHHAVMFPILPGKTLADVEGAFTGRAQGPPPVDFAGATGTAVLDGDSEAVTDLFVRKPGRYAVVCFIADRDGNGAEHVAEGMLEEVSIK